LHCRRRRRRRRKRRRRRRRSPRGIGALQEGDHASAELLRKPSFPQSHPLHA